MRVEVGWEDLTSVCVVEVVQKGQCQYLYEASVRREGVEEEKENYPNLCVGCKGVKEERENYPNLCDPHVLSFL